ncbi:enhancer of split mgamma protein-like [Artemia franciscana]|uniref:Uncharacterized protein n=1 Tax=Artemia franciscana TaxID=6661 RepID=A0AA88HFP4_ARTSF|nr:hypothetical protein QYM36_013201 [Artemia franciscana]
MSASLSCNFDNEHPISRTYQYRKVMKPMLERKRRARINRCLEELKELMCAALVADGENLAKLEKADVLELTVRHLHRLREQKALFPDSNPMGKTEHFKAGFTHCAAEVSRFLTQAAGVDNGVSARLVSHLSQCAGQIEPAPSVFIQHQNHFRPTPPSSPETLTNGYSRLLALAGAATTMPKIVSPIPSSPSSYRNVLPISPVNQELVHFKVNSQNSKQENMWRPW